MLALIITLSLFFAVNGFISQFKRNMNPRIYLEMARKPLIAGNWKMNTDLTSAIELATELVELTRDVDPSEREIAVCPPFPFLAPL